MQFMCILDKLYTHQNKRSIFGLQRILRIAVQLEGLKDIDQPIVSRIEKGEGLVTDYEIKAIAKALKVMAEWLLNEK
jgi:hypothetical protein